MDAIIDAYVAFIALIWLGLMAIAVAGMARPNTPERQQARSNYTPKALVMVPCKGLDISLRKNLASLMRQSYGNYDVVAILDDISDPALQVIRSLGMKCITSARAWKHASGKVRALATAIKKLDGYDVYVVADSDATFRFDWLARLVAPLSDKTVGVSTAFPYFLPMGGFWSKVKMVWGFVGNGMMESKLTRFAWGGSMAFRKELLRGRSFSEFSKSVSDDIPVTRIAKRKGLSIHYVSERVVRVPSNDDFAHFVEWSTRQTALSILGNKKVFAYGTVFYAANAVLLVSGIALALLVSWPFALLLLPFLLGAIKTYRRSHSNDPALLAVYLMTSFIYIANLIAAKRMTHIVWRGSRYKLV